MGDAVGPTVGDGYQPSIDGLRAVAVVAVLAFHSGIMHAPGGFLGVSLFFTISGYIITSILLREHAAQGRIGLRSFWARRWRRLMPVALVTLVAIAAVAPHTGPGAPSLSLRGDLFAALGYVENWHVLARGARYADLFAAPSPVLHFWSLAIEEQFYIVFPLVVAAVLSLRGGSRRALFCVLGALTAASLVWQVVLNNVDRVYLGTDTRAAELLAGALLAIVLERRGAPGVRARRVWSVASAAGLALLVFLVATTSDRAAWLGRGGFGVVAVISVALIGGALAGASTLRFLAWAPLVAIGRVSFGVYLFHWPVFIWLDEERTGLRGVPLLVLRVAVVALITVVSYHVLECPVRYGRALPRAGALVGVTGLTVAGAVLLATALPVAAHNVPLVDPSAVRPLWNASLPATPPAPKPPPLRVMVVGDESAGRIAWLLTAQANGRVIVDNASRPRCPVDLVIWTRRFNGDTPYHTVCYDWPLLWRAEARRFHPDIVVVSSTQELNEMGPTTWQFADLTSATLYNETVEAFDSAVQQLRASGAVVAWATVPSSAELASAGPQMARRHALLNQAISTAVQREVGAVSFNPASVSIDAIDQADAAARHELGLDASSLERKQVVRVLVTGDSTSLSIAAALAAHGLDQHDMVVDWAGQIGCPVVSVARIRKIGAGTDIEDESDCRRAADLWPEHMAMFKPDIVLVVTSYMEAADLMRTPDRGWEHLDQPEFDAYASAQYDADVHLAASTGARVAWATAPREDGATWSASSVLHARLTRLNTLLGELATRHPKLQMIPLAALVDRADGVVDRDARPDGVHFTLAAARTIVDSWLAHMLIEAVNPRQSALGPVVARH